MRSDDRPRRPWLLGLVIALISGVVVVALATSETSGTGAVNVGDDGREPVEDIVAPAPTPDSETDSREAPRRDCEPTESNPGGTNNYIPDAPSRRIARPGLRDHRAGPVRQGLPAAAGRARAGLAGDRDRQRAGQPGERRTDGDGRYRIETAKTVPQFGEPNIHVGYDDGEYGAVFIRRVVDLDDRRAVVDLTLARRD